MVQPVSYRKSQKAGIMESPPTKSQSKEIPPLPRNAAFKLGQLFLVSSDGFLELLAKGFSGKILHICYSNLVSESSQKLKLSAHPFRSKWLVRERTMH